MAEPAIEVEELSKRYRLGRREGYLALRDTLARAPGAPARWLRRRLGGSSAPAEPDVLWALDGVSFRADEGEILGVIGANGAGKSTLLKVLSRITEPTRGRAVIRGRVGSLLEVGTGFHPELSGRENVFLNGAILGMGRQEIARKFDEIIAFAEVERFVDTPVKHYSSGMYVRLAFAVAAHLEPEVLLIDEVLAVGDAAFQQRCLGRMESVARSGRTVLFVSHNMGMLVALCPRAIQLAGGRVVRDGPAGEVTEAYLNEGFAGGGEHAGPGYTVDPRALAPAPGSEAATGNLPTGGGGSGRAADAAGTGFRFTALAVENPAAPAVGPRTGEPLAIRIGYAAGRDFLSPAFVVQIRTPFGQELIRLSSMPISGFPIEKLGAAGTVELTIDSLPLVAGPYLIDVGFVRERVEWIAAAPGAIRMEVTGRDVYGSGTVLDQSRGLVTVDHHWQHRREG